MKRYMLDTDTSSYVIRERPASVRLRFGELDSGQLCISVVSEAELLYGVKALIAMKPENNDQKAGIDIVRRALAYPTRLIAENAGADSSMIVGKLLEQDDVNRGFDAQTGNYTDMVKAGIIDPTKVVRLALQGAASVAALLITTEAMIGEKGDSQDGSLPVGGGMGGTGF